MDTEAFVISEFQFRTMRDPWAAEILFVPGSLGAAEADFRVRSVTERPVLGISGLGEGIITGNRGLRLSTEARDEAVSGGLGLGNGKLIPHLSKHIT